MSCSCGEKFQRVYPTAIKFTVYLTGDRTAAPVQWTEPNFPVCIGCGAFTAQVPEGELQILREGAGEHAA